MAGLVMRKLSSIVADAISKWLPLFTVSLSSLILTTLAIIALNSSVRALNEQLISSCFSRIENIGSVFSFRLSSLMNSLKHQTEQTILRNSLADSEGLESYLRPHLDTLRLGDKSISRLVLLNSIGEPIASSGTPGDKFALHEHKEILAAMQSGKPIYKILNNASATIILPILFPPTGRFEGALLTQINLDDIAIDSITSLKTLVKDEKVDLRFVKKTEIDLTHELPKYLLDYAYTATGRFPLSQPFDNHNVEVRYTIPTIQQREAVIKTIFAYSMMLVFSWVSFFILAGWIRNRYVEPIEKITAIAQQIAQQPESKHLQSLSGESPTYKLQQSVLSVIDVLNKSQNNHREKIKLTFEKLSHTKAQLENIANDAGVIAFSVNLDDGKIFYCTDSLSKLGLLTAEENLHWSKIFRLITNPEERSAVRNAIKTIFSHQRSNCQVNVSNKSETKTYEINLKFVHELRGRRPYINCFAIDITEKSKLHLALLQSEQRKAAIINGAIDGYVTLGEDFTVTEINPAAEKILGRRNVELLGNNFHDHCIAPGYQLTFRKFCDQLISTAGKNSLATTEPIFFRNSKNENIPVEIRSSLLLSGNGYQICLYLKDLRDSYAQKLAISKKKAQISTIFSLSPDGFALFERGTLSAFNQPLHTILSIKPEELILGISDNDFWKMIGAHSKKPDSKTIKKILDSEEQAIVIETPKKKLVKYEQRKPADKKFSDTWIYFFRDATKEFQLHEIKSQFLATAAHELRTPLTTILGFSELLSIGKIAEKDRNDLLSSIHRHSLHLKSLINDLLDLAKIDSLGENILTHDTLDLTTVLTQVYQNVSASLDGKRMFDRHEITLDLPDSRPLMALIDRTMVMRAVLNLLSNAAKYSAESKPIILSARTVDEFGKSFVKISITDQGIGMTPEELCLAFTRFWRADTASGNIPGTGLGLSLVKEIAEMHHGKLILESNYGTGTTASLLLPLLDVRAPENTHA